MVDFSSIASFASKALSSLKSSDDGTASSSGTQQQGSGSVFTFGQLSQMNQNLTIGDLLGGRQQNS